MEGEGIEKEYSRVQQYVSDFCGDSEKLSSLATLLSPNCPMVFISRLLGLTCTLDSWTRARHGEGGSFLTC